MKIVIYRPSPSEIYFRNASVINIKKYLYIIHHINRSKDKILLSQQIWKESFITFNNYS